MGARREGGSAGRGGRGGACAGKRARASARRVTDRARRGEVATTRASRLRPGTGTLVRVESGSTGFGLSKALWVSAVSTRTPFKNLFRYEKILDFTNVALLFICNKYYSIID
jgi:hypothetical protein